ncbi:hypothetical protein BDP27DRAFT_1372018 [Rhodocollybia butyracea]|uniref:DUF6535 domain-containing protein n=1 Tax=Rhodocollybia butyracea TaxID=206335 RepID=A0A9P5TX01_9AGAR|nr:hypothetical protein BDP27DRAFT_1372018 [Rhodocollybia butyracea]
MEFAVVSDEDLHPRMPPSPLVDPNGRAKDPESTPHPHSTFPAQERESNSAINIDAIRTAVSNLHEAVVGSEEKTNRAGLCRSADKHFKSTRFGLKKERLHRVVHPTTENYNYKLKYPEDERYHELDEEARIWWVYLDEATAFDNDMFEKLGDSLDILLVFAGLFSAILTTFLAQTYQSLSQDYSQLAASYLGEVTMLIRANTNSTAISLIPLTSTVFSPSMLNLWVNGLWFVSLTVALSVALFAVLAKQWLRQYMSIITGTPRERAFIRQFRLNGLKKWRVQAIIGMLPALLHLALILFLAGLVIFLIPLNVSIAYIVGAATISVVVLYLTATFLPLFTVQCAYKTTFTDILYYAFHQPWAIFLRVISPLTISVYNWNRELAGLNSLDPKNFQTKGYISLKAAERHAARAKSSTADQNLELTALWWLGETTSSPSAKEILFQSLGAFTSNMTEKLSTSHALRVLYGCDSFDALIDLLRRHVRDAHAHAGGATLDRLESIFRSVVHLNHMKQQELVGIRSIHPEYFKNFFQFAYINDSLSKFKPATWETISFALTALAFGVQSVRFWHEGQHTYLSPEDAIPWLVATYRQELGMSNLSVSDKSVIPPAGDADSDVRLNLPTITLPALVWKALLQTSANAQRMKVLLEDIPDEHSETPYPISPTIFTKQDDIDNDLRV